MNHNKLFPHPLICEPENPEFKVVVKYLLNMIDSALHEDETDAAQHIFSTNFEVDFPENSNLTNIEFEKVFVGSKAGDFTKAYKHLLQTWMDVQENQIPGSKAVITQSEFSNRLKTSQEKLKELSISLL